jgi:hypothetical protein
VPKPSHRPSATTCLMCAQHAAPFDHHLLARDTHKHTPPPCLSSLSPRSPPDILHPLQLSSRCDKDTYYCTTLPPANTIAFLMQRKRSAVRILASHQKPKPGQTLIRMPGCDLGLGVAGDELDCCGLLRRENTAVTAQGRGVRGTEIVAARPFEW